MISNPTLILICILQILIQPNINDPKGLVMEGALFLCAVILGSGVRVALRVRDKEVVSKTDIFIVVFLALAVGFMTNYLLLFYKSTLPRIPIVMASAFLAESIMRYIEKTYPAIFNKGIQKFTGIDVENNETKSVDLQNNQTEDEKTTDTPTDN
jgi:cytochrome bd-type quinol oxidase subunit 2